MKNGRKTENKFITENRGQFVNKNLRNLLNEWLLFPMEYDNI